MLSTPKRSSMVEKKLGGIEAIAYIAITSQPRVSPAREDVAVIAFRLCESRDSSCATRRFARFARCARAIPVSTAAGSREAGCGESLRRGIDTILTRRIAVAPSQIKD
jgi:hypothetical protein